MKIEIVDGNATIVLENPGESITVRETNQANQVANIEKKQEGVKLTTYDEKSEVEKVSIAKDKELTEIDYTKKLTKEELVAICDEWLEKFKIIFEYTKDLEESINYPKLFISSIEEKITLTLTGNKLLPVIELKDIPVAISMYLITNLLVMYHGEFGQVVCDSIMNDNIANIMRYLDDKRLMKLVMLSIKNTIDSQVLTPEFYKGLNTATVLASSIEEKRNNSISMDRKSLIEKCDKYFETFTELFQNYLGLGENYHREVRVKFITSKEKAERVSIILTIEDHEEYTSKIRIQNCNVAGYLMIKIFAYIRYKISGNLFFSSADECFKGQRGTYTIVCLDIKDDYYGLKNALYNFHIAFRDDLTDYHIKEKVFYEYKRAITSEDMTKVFLDDISEAEKLSEKIKQEAKQKQYKAN